MRVREPVSTLPEPSALIRFNLCRLDAEAVGDGLKGLAANAMHLALLDAGDCLGGDSGRKILAPQAPLLAQPPQRGAKRPLGSQSLVHDSTTIVGIELIENRVRGGFITAKPNGLPATMICPDVAFVK